MTFVASRPQHRRPALPRGVHVGRPRGAAAVGDLLEARRDAVEVVRVERPRDLTGRERRPQLDDAAAGHVDGEHVDIGLVGDVVEVSPGAVQSLLSDGRIPVVSSVARDADGQIYNVNADTAAAALAVSLDAEKFVVLTDVEGLYANYPDPESIISELTAEQLEPMLP